MLEADKPVFLRVSDESKNRVLHPGKIIGVEDNTYNGEFDWEEELSCEKDEAVFIYFEDARKFMQQSARICSIAEVESKFEITLETTGSPVSAESRECYRVSTVLLGLTVSVADDRDCPLLDISATGMSATTTSPLRMGDEIAAMLSFDGREYSGSVIVQSVGELRGGRIRHGFLSVTDRRCGGNLQQGLQATSASVQRLLIKRLARI